MSLLAHVGGGGAPIAPDTVQSAYQDGSIANGSTAMLYQPVQVAGVTVYGTPAGDTTSSVAVLGTSYSGIDASHVAAIYNDGSVTVTSTPDLGQSVAGDTYGSIVGGKGVSTSIAAGVAGSSGLAIGTSPASNSPSSTSGGSATASAAATPSSNNSTLILLALAGLGIGYFLLRGR